MKRKAHQASSTRATLRDRLVCAAFSGLSGLLLGAIIWFAVFWKLGSSQLAPSFAPVWALAGLMAVLGLCLNSNGVAALVGGLLRVVLRLDRF